MLSRSEASLYLDDNICRIGRPIHDLAPRDLATAASGSRQRDDPLHRTPVAHDWAIETVRLKGRASGLAPICWSNVVG